AAAVTQQHALDNVASAHQRGLELLCDGGTQLALVAGLQRRQLLELGRDCDRVEDLGEACRSRGRDQRGHVQHGSRLAEQASAVTEKPRVTVLRSRDMTRATTLDNLCIVYRSSNIDK